MSFLVALNSKTKKESLLTGLSYTSIDVYFENESVILKVELDFTEPFSSEVPNFKRDGDAVGNLTKCKDAFDLFVQKGVPRSFLDDVLLYYIGNKEEMNLDSLEIIKTTLALIMEGKRTGGSPYTFMSIENRKKTLLNFKITRKN